ncbi:CD5 antigen-like isoform X3 [Peromyscus maniculatus bairdii]|uniref:CD5 antigen-like isoform X3 n=1 Tax=Peromyscus maniculatus bairdii TaxID=230844 RepID=UPI003FCF0BE5
MPSSAAWLMALLLNLMLAISTVFIGSCLSESPSKVRLVGGAHRCEGRVEVERNGQWGTVCDDGWDLNDVAVVCRELSCGAAIKARSGSSYKPPAPQEQKVLIRDFNCRGMEDTLSQCEQDGHVYNCPHTKDAGAQCEKSPSKVQLVGGAHRCEGRVEVERNGQWGTVCDDGWDLNDVAVVCRELSCGAAIKARSGTSYKPPAPEEQKVLIRDFNCKGMEDTLSQCEQDGHVYNCQHTEDAGAQCENPDIDSPFIPENVRLVDGPGRCQGRVEVLHQLEWSSVCKAGWNLQASKVACRQLGCGRALLTHACCNKTTQGKGPIWASQMSCAGQEANLRDCPFRSLEKNCTHDEDAWVECEDPFELKLVGGDNPCSGRLEVLHQGTWGSVCDDGWGEKEDQVVCKQLGCGKPLVPSSKARKSYGPGAGRVWLDDVVCSGEEQSLESCRHRFWGYHDCTHKEDVAVICSESIPRL